MVYESFLDDSKDGGQKQMIVSAGFCGPKDAWADLRKAWNKRLQEDGLEYFKTSEFRMLKGQFLPFRDLSQPRDKANKLRSDLQAIVALHRQIMGFGVAIDEEDYQETIKTRKAENIFGANPYHRALESVMYETVQHVRSLPGRNVVAFVHDDGEDFTELHNVYKAFKAKNPRTSKYMMGFMPLNDKQHPPLQLADMIANLTMHLGLDWLDNGRTQPKLEQMRQSIEKLGIWNKSYVEAVLDSNIKSNAKAERRAQKLSDKQTRLGAGRQ